MTKCTVCWAWQPKDWDGSKGHWADTIAKCQLKNRFTTAGESCEDGRIVKPKTVVNRMDTYQTLHGVTVAKEEPIPVQQPQARIDKPMTGELYAHQKEAFERFKDASEAALFMEMGTGKSATVLRIAGHKFKTGQIDALLIVAPNDVHVQWAREQVPLWLDCAYDIQCLFGRGGNKLAYAFTEDPEYLQVVCVNIDTFSTPSKWQDIVAWANSKQTFIVLDEATVIKNVTSQRTQRLLYEFNTVIRRKKAILSSTPNSVARAILTGTPVTNGPMDMWSMMEFLRPNYFNRNWYSFKSHFGMFTNILVNDRVIQVPLSQEVWTAIKGIQTFAEANAIFGCSEDTFNTIHAQEKYEGPYKHADELKKLIQPVSYFKLLTDCVDMPARNYITRQMQMSPEQERCYVDMVTELMATYNEHTATAKNKLTAIIRLQQITSGFICDKHLVDDDAMPMAESAVSSLYGLIDEEDIMPDEIEWIGSSNPKLDALYRDIDEAAKPCIIITRFTAEADRIYNDLFKKYATCLMTGWKRVGSVEEFKAGKYDVMVANSSVIARGFNLQNSHTMLFYSNTFSLETRLQGEGRIFRLGQDVPCEYIDYTYTDTVDEKIIAALVMKRNLLDYIRNATITEVVK